MKIFKMIIIFMLCFLLVGCGGKSKSDQVKEAYFEKGGEYALYKIEQLYGKLETRSTKDLEEVVELSDWMIQEECKKTGLEYNAELGEVIIP